MRSPPPLAAAAFCVLAACVPAQRTPEPLRLGDLGRRLPSSTRVLAEAGVLASCREGYAGLSGEAQAAESVVTSWYDVVSRIDRCEIGAARYYAGPDTEAAISGRLASLASDAPGACGAQARGLLARVRAANRRVQEWLPLAVELCSHKELAQDAYASAARFARVTAALRCQIARDFPEMGQGGCQ